MPLLVKKFVFGTSTLAAIVICAAIIAHGLSPLSARGAKADGAQLAPASVLFTVEPGEGFRAITSGLQSKGLIRSAAAADVFSLLDGSALHLKAGSYELNSGMSAVQILGTLSSGGSSEVTVTIPEGKNIYEIDSILSNAGVLKPGELIGFTEDGNLEGKLFPDTYRFFTDSGVSDVVQKFLDDFNSKAGPLLAAQGKNTANDLIMASLIQKEVPDMKDQEVVAGILWKRINAGMPLQVDATLCYALWIDWGKTVGSSEGNAGASASSTPDCEVLDTKVDSAYNTYLNKGFPPAPIGNPGVSAIEAAINPTSSPYWYYLSDPKTGKTVFAKTLDEQHQNTVKYLVNQ